MTGLPENNYPAFQHAAAALKAHGFEVIDPSRNLTPEPFEEGGPVVWSDWMRVSLQQVVQARAVAYLPGWDLSVGASLEVHVAKSLGLPVLPWNSMLFMDPHTLTETNQQEAANLT